MPRLLPALGVLGAGLLAAACWSASATMLPPPQSPQAVVDQLLEADRRFGAASARTTLTAGLTAMFAQDVVMQAPGGMMRGLAAATQALDAVPSNAGAKLSWVPIRGGVSADGTHGFTFGFMTLTQADGQQVPLKYLAYWIKRDGQWRVAGYKRRGRAAGAVSTTILPASLPATLLPAVDDPAIIAAHARGLKDAEQAFSDAAQQIGLGPAFVRFGWPDAMNMGGPTDAGFVLGNDNIGRTIGNDYPQPTSPLYWSADDVLVASTGDLGVTFGRIRVHVADGQPEQPPIPFFTIWRRDLATGQWKYIAE